MNNIIKLKPSSVASLKAVRENEMGVFLDAETGNRGYQLTGKSSFLQPYNESMSALPRAMENDKSDDVTDPKQIQRLKDI